MDMSNNREEQWIRASHGLNRVEAFMIPVLQGLGRLDCHLIAQDERFARLSESERSTIQESILLTDQFTLSYLWVLGAYEFVRTLNQRCHSDRNLFGDSITKRIRELKHQIERLRIPLAKMEPARRHPNDNPIAYPAISRDHGIAWQLTPDDFISRKELSEVLLLLVSDIREHFSSAD